LVFIHRKKEEQEMEKVRRKNKRRKKGKENRGKRIIRIDFGDQVTRALAPLGADRFYALVQDGFYAKSEDWEDNDSALFRVVPNFVLQFGISGQSGWLGP
jgi:cyclophilin family peptidyl-prolyl cis-trans isomerase